MDDVIDVGMSVESSLTMPATEPMCAQAAVNLSPAVAEMSLTKKRAQSKPNCNLKVVSSFLTPRLVTERA